MELTYQRGDLVVCVLSGDYGKPRPAVIVQSDFFNSTHASITICPMTSMLVATPLFRITIPASKSNGLKQGSQIMVDKIMSISKNKIHEKIGELNSKQQEELSQAIKTWLDL